MSSDFSSPVEKFYALLREIAVGLGTTVPEGLEHFNEAVSENIVGNIEFSNADGTMVKLHLELEKMTQGAGVRATLFFGLNHEEKEWAQHPDFLKALLLCRVIPGNCLPVAPAVFSDDEMFWQLLVPLHEQTREPLEAFILATSSFYQAAVKKIRDTGFDDELAMELRKTDRASDVIWTLKKWEQQKERSPQAVENYSAAGHYYRLMPPTRENPGMVAINLGNVSDFIGLHRILMELLKINAYTFLNDDYYVGFDDRGGLLLHAFLSPADEEIVVKRLSALLKRAEEVRNFILKITSDLEAAAMQDHFKTMGEVETLVFN